MSGCCWVSGHLTGYKVRLLINLESTLGRILVERATMSAKLFALLLIGAVAAIANAEELICQCCGDNPPQTCSWLRIQFGDGFCDRPDLKARR